MLGTPLKTIPTPPNRTSMRKLRYDSHSNLVSRDALNTDPGVPLSFSSCFVSVILFTHPLWFVCASFSNACLFDVAKASVESRHGSLTGGTPRVELFTPHPHPQGASVVVCCCWLKSAGPPHHSGSPETKSETLQQHGGP